MCVSGLVHVIVDMDNDAQLFNVFVKVVHASLLCEGMSVIEDFVI